MRKLVAILALLCAHQCFAASGTPQINITPLTTSAGGTGQLRFYELLANGALYVGLKAPDTVTPSSVIWTLPAADGSNGQVLSTNGMGALSWSNSGSSSAPFADNAALVENNADHTKLAIFSAANISTATTRTYTLVNGSGSIPLAPTAGLMTFSGPSAARTYTIADATCTILTSNAAVTAGQGGTGSTTVPTTGQVLVGNAGGTAYAPQSLSGDGTLNNSGVLTVTATSGTAFAASATVNALNASNISSGTLGVGEGGLGITSGTSGGILGFTATGTIASSALLTQNQIMIGGGAGATPTTLGSLGTTTTVLHGNAGGAPSYAAVGLTTDVSGILPTANGGTGIAYFTAAGPSAARVYTFPDAACSILTTNAAVTVAQGGTGIATGTSGGVPYFSGATSMASSAQLAQHAILIGGGAAAAPYSLTTGVGATHNLLHANTGADPTWSTIDLTSDVGTSILPVADGGTGLSTATTAYGVICAGTSATSAFQNAGAGTTGYFLTSNGASALPTWTSVTPGSITATAPLVVTGANIAIGTAIGGSGDANADAILKSSGAGKTAFVIQSANSNSQPLIKGESSAAVVQWQIDNTITSNTDVAETLQTSNLSNLKIQSISENITVAAAATSNSATNLIPANSFIIGVSYNVTTVIPTATTFSVGDSVSATRYGTGISVAATTTSSSLLASPPTEPFGNGAAKTILLTMAGGTPAGATGRVRVTVFYITLAAPGN